MPDFGGGAAEHVEVVLRARLGLRAAFCGLSLHLPEVHRMYFLQITSFFSWGIPKMQSHLPESDLLVPRPPTVLLEFVGGFGMNAGLSKVPGDFFDVAVIGDGVLPIVDLLLPPHQDTFIRLQVGRQRRHRLLRIRTS